MLVELAGGDNASVRLLTNALMSLANVQVDCFVNKVDVAKMLERKLRIHIPRRRDYMAGARFASKSYYESMSNTAELVLIEAQGYVTWRRRLHF